MNILLIISKNDKYGAQRIFLDQVDVLNRMGNQVVVVGRGSEGYVPESVRAMDVEYHGIPLKGIQDIFYLRRLLKKQRIDVIHTILDRADYFGVILSWVTRRPVVSTMMVPRYHGGFKFADKVIVLSQKQRKVLEDKGISSEKINVIRPGIAIERFADPDPDKRDAWKNKLEIEKYGVVLCHIASMIPRKGHMVSLELVAECKKQGVEPLLVIIGDPLSGEYYESLVKTISDAGLTRNVCFTGWTSEIPEILALSHYTVLPSENEALGIVLMEGMAAGTPIIARADEGGAELIEEFGTGFLYNPDEGIKALADNITALCRDKARYIVLADKCRVIAEKNFSTARFGERLIELYQSIITR